MFITKEFGEEKREAGAEQRDWGAAEAGRMVLPASLVLQCKEEGPHRDGWGPKSGTRYLRGSFVMCSYSTRLCPGVNAQAATLSAAMKPTTAPMLMYVVTIAMDAASGVPVTVIRLAVTATIDQKMPE